VIVLSDLWSRYVQVFGGLWVASAFKGATGPCATATDIGYHIENHKEWLAVVNNDIRPLTDKFRGYALTGWQRLLIALLTLSCLL
jgi:hexosaminidase